MPFSASTFIFISCTLFVPIFFSVIYECSKGIIFDIIILKNGSGFEPSNDSNKDEFSEQHTKPPYSMPNFD